MYVSHVCKYYYYLQSKTVLHNVALVILKNEKILLQFTSIFNHCIKTYEVLYRKKKRKTSGNAFGFFDHSVYFSQ